MYGLYLLDENKIEVYQDMTGVASRLKVTGETIARWLKEHKGSYMGHRWFLTNDVDIHKSKRGGVGGFIKK